MLITCYSLTCISYINLSVSWYRGDTFVLIPTSKQMCTRAIHSADCSAMLTDVHLKEVGGRSSQQAYVLIANDIVHLGNFREEVESQQALKGKELRIKVQNS